MGTGINKIRNLIKQTGFPEVEFKFTTFFTVKRIGGKKAVIGGFQKMKIETRIIQHLSLSGKTSASVKL